MALTERLQETTRVGFWRGEIPLEYIYTYGRAGEKYFRRLMEDGRFMGARCDRCRITYVPPRIYCEKCFARLEDNFVDVGSEGVVHTFTVLYRNLDGTRKEAPSVMAMVRLDGAQGGVVHRLGEVSPEKVHIGMKVRAVLKPTAGRTGGITDIEYFAPV